MRYPRRTLVRQIDTCRLIPSRFAHQEDSVLNGIAESKDHLKDLFELDNATNERLLAEHGRGSIGIDELIFGVPNFRIVNAAFVYARPQGNRFSGDERGAWYCAFETETALAEIIFHKTIEYSEINRFEDCVSYQAYLADLNGEFHDIRGDKLFNNCLNPDSYIASQKLAADLLELESLGIIYPSVRRPEGTNLVCFRPAVVGNVRLGKAYDLTWNGTPSPVVAERTS